MQNSWKVFVFLSGKLVAECDWKNGKDSPSLRVWYIWNECPPIIVPINMASLPLPLPKLNGWNWFKPAEISGIKAPWLLGEPQSSTDIMEKPKKSTLFMDRYIFWYTTCILSGQISLRPGLKPPGKGKHHLTWWWFSKGTLKMPLGQADGNYSPLPRCILSHRIRGTGTFTYIYGYHVGKYTSPMDATWVLNS